MVCEGRGRASEREGEVGAINASRSNEVKTPQQVAFPPTEKKSLTLVYMFQGGVKARPRYMRWVRAATTLSPLLSLAPSPPTPPTWRVRALVFIWFYFGLSVICLANTTQRVCPSVCLSACLSVFLFIFRLFAWLLARAIESNYNICEEGSSNHGRHGMARCDTMRS